MKQKFANRPNWARITQKRYFQEYRTDPGFVGHLSLLFLDQVTHPLSVRYGNHEIRIVDHGHAWLLFFPENSHYSLTVMIDSELQVLQWYFDIVKSTQLTSEGIPVIEDLYLDLVVLPNGELFVLDEDELEEARQAGEIEESDYRLAIEEMAALRACIERGELELIHQVDRYLEILRQYKNRA